MTRVGGHKRRAWRLKKKYDKWFVGVLREVIRDTLADLPDQELEYAFSHIYNPPLHKLFGLKPIYPSTPKQGDER